MASILWINHSCAFSWAKAATLNDVVNGVVNSVVDDIVNDVVVNPFLSEWLVI